MRVLTCGRNFKLTDAIARHVEERVEAALGPVGGRINHVTARLDDTNGPRGGRDKRCRIVVWMRHTGILVAEAVHDDLYVAVDEAVATARDTIHRRFTRRRTLHRTFVQRRRRPLPA